MLVYPYPGYPFTPGEVFVGGLVVGMVIAAISESAQPVEVNNPIVYYDGEYYNEPVTDGDEVVYKVVPPPPGGIGAAVRDRLRRAAAGSSGAAGASGATGPSAPTDPTDLT